MVIWKMNLWEIIKAGGPIMIPILLCSIISLAIVIEKLFYFSSLKTDTLKFKQRVFEMLKANKITEAINFCDTDSSPVAKILKAGILKFGATRDEIKEAMEDVSLFEIPKLEKRLSALATIAHISPLLGLLGTVTGICGSFYTIQVKSTSLSPVTPGDLAAGIWEALITTVAGLVVAIPTFVVYNYFVNRVNTIVLEMERTATELVNLLGHLSDSQSVKLRKGSLRTEI